MLEFLESTPNLTIIEGMVENLIVNDNKVGGVILSDGKELKSDAVILTTGTYLKANILIGSEKEAIYQLLENALSDNQTEAELCETHCAH